MKAVFIDGPLEGKSFPITEVLKEHICSAKTSGWSVDMHYTFRDRLSDNEHKVFVTKGTSDKFAICMLVNKYLRY